MKSKTPKHRATCPWCAREGVLVTLPSGRNGWVLRKHQQRNGLDCTRGSHQVVEEENVWIDAPSFAPELLAAVERVTDMYEELYAIQFIQGMSEEKIALARSYLAQALDIARSRRTGEATTAQIRYLIALYRDIGIPVPDEVYRCSAQFASEMIPQLVEERERTRALRRGLAAEALADNY